MVCDISRDFSGMTRLNPIHVTTLDAIVLGINYRAIVVWYPSPYICAIGINYTLLAIIILTQRTTKSKIACNSSKYHNSYIIKYHLYDGSTIKIVKANLSFLVIIIFYYHINRFLTKSYN